MKVVVAALTGMGNAAINTLRRAKMDVTAVITDPTNGPGFPHYACPDLIETCHRQRIPVWSGMDLSRPASVRRIVRAAPAAFVIATSYKIVPMNLVEKLGGRVINCHPSLLPRHRGPTPVPWTIEHGDRETGLTFIQPVAQLDAGPIWHQCRTPVKTSETSGELRYRLDQVLLPEVLPAVVEGVVAGRLQAVPQTGTASWESKFVLCAEEIDWTNDGVNRCLQRFRARTPYPGVYLRYGTFRYRITKLTGVKGMMGMAAGTVEMTKPGRFVIHVVDGVLTAEVRTEIEGGAVARPA